MMTGVTPVAIIGAGPYGLSIAAHLRGERLPFRIFGNSMFSWMRQMPKGMRLKSEGFASSLSDPQGRFTLGRFCAQQGLDYQDLGYPIPLDTLIAYGLAFQQEFAPQVEDKKAIGIERSSEGFCLTFEDGQTVIARSVVLATGIDYFRNLPRCLSNLPKDLVTHSADHHDLARFAGREVVVIGGGASAIDLAALLEENGARVELVHRRSQIAFNPDPAPQPRSLVQRIRYPLNGLGAGWRSLFCAETPHLFYRLPESVRVRIATTLIPSAAGWFMNGRLKGNVSLLLGHSPERAEIRGNRVHLHLTDDQGNKTERVADHVIAATGYRFDLSRLNILGEDLRSQIRLVENLPDLSPDFQSSVPRLYFAGPITLANFGPVVRFIAGTNFTARCVAKSLARNSRHS